MDILVKKISKIGKKSFLYFSIFSFILFGFLFYSYLNLNKNLNKNESKKTSINQNLFLNPINSSFNFPQPGLIDEKSFKAIFPLSIFHSETLTILTGSEEKDLEIEPRKYIVQEKDTLYSISQKFGVSIKTIAYVNNLKNEIINPGDELTIPPVDGVIHIVEKNETIENLAKKYEVDPEKIRQFNKISPAEELFEEELLIIPDAKIPDEFAFEKKKEEIKKIKTTFFSNGTGNGYVPGYCTWYVATKRKIPPDWGNAVNWLSRAKADGYQVCIGSNCPPAAGAIVSLKSHDWRGHVGYVEKVIGNKILISEMNYGGVWIKNKRLIEIGSSIIKGYIY